MQPGAGFGFYEQQHALLLAQGIKNPNVRKQLITDLALFINNLQAEGHEIIVSLNANETIGEDKTMASLTCWNPAHSSISTI